MNYKYLQKKTEKSRKKKVRRFIKTIKSNILERANQGLSEYEIRVGLLSKNEQMFIELALDDLISDENFQVAIEMNFTEDRLETAKFYW